MKHIRRFSLGLLGATAVTGILIACGDDDSVLLGVPPDSGADQFIGTDSSAKDVTTTDTNPNPPDGSDIVDSGVDAAHVDAGPVDAQADVELPPVDSGSPDAAPADLAMEFPGRVAAEICRTTARCCFGDAEATNDAGVDGGHYNEQSCRSLYLPQGFDSSSPGSNPNFAKLSYDVAKGTECLSRIHVLSCGANAAEYKAVVAACYAALKGVGGAGAACTLQSECQPGFFCNTSVAGGTCEAIRTTGGACGDWGDTTSTAQNSCSTRFSGQPPRFCNTRDDAGAAAPAASWTCTDARPNGQKCLNNTWCDGTGVCVSGGGGSTCQGFINIFNPTGCGFFVSQ